MPELPEVETIVRDLSRLVVGAVIDRVEVIKDDLIEGDPRKFENDLGRRRIGQLDRRAKNIVVTLDAIPGRPDHLIINLGMTGRVLVIDPAETEPDHLGVRFGLADGRRLLYQDVRRFGRLATLSAEEWSARSQKLGLEPLAGEFTAERLFRITRGSRSPIKPWLMDQHRVVGIGNIYASEALFRARVSPRKAAGRLTRAETARLRDAVAEVLQDAIEFRGTTLLDYRDASGKRGSFAQRLRVYDREGEPCLVCRTPIRRIVQAGRSTFYCPTCQGPRGARGQTDGG